MKQKKFTNLLLAICYLLLAAGFLLPATILAQEPDYDRINEVAKQMNCPTCVGINLADCRTQTCQQWRDQIADLLEQGYSEQEVLDYFATQYGNQVLLEPPKQGPTLLLWVLPVAAILVGGGWLVYVLRRWNKNQPAVEAAAAPAAPPPGQKADDYLSQVEKDLAD